MIIFSLRTVNRKCLQALLCQETLISTETIMPIPCVPEFSSFFLVLSISVFVFSSLRCSHGFCPWPRHLQRDQCFWTDYWVTCLVLTCCFVVGRFSIPVFTNLQYVTFLLTATYCSLIFCDFQT